MNERGFRPHLGKYILNWARGTSSGWWNKSDGTAPQTQDLKGEPWWSEVEHASCRSLRFPTILNLCEWARKKLFLNPEYQSWARTRDLRLSRQAALTTTPGLHSLRKSDRAIITWCYSCSQPMTLIWTDIPHHSFSRSHLPQWRIQRGGGVGGRAGILKKLNYLNIDQNWQNISICHSKCYIFTLSHLK